MTHQTDTSEKNVGHGHVYPRPDGMKARCGGPAICSECAADLARQDRDAKESRLAAKKELTRLREALQFIRDLEPGSRGAYGKFKEAQDRARLALAGRDPEPPSFSPNFDERNGL